jgi:2-hydroxy-6-oxonona-2,4-dienedioate hydrolase
MEVRFIEAGGLRTRCLVAGKPDAYPLLMLHGYGGTADVFVRNIDELGKDFLTVSVDMVGSGFTEAADDAGRPPQEAAVRHLVALADHFGWRRFCPIGTSYGSLIGALLYFAVPDRVDRLVINGSANCFASDDDVRRAMERVLVNFKPLMEAPSVEGCRAAMVKQVYDPSTVLEDVFLTMATAYAQPGMLDVWERGARALMQVEEGRSWRIMHRLEKLDVETLVIWGREDPGAPYASAVDAVRRMKHAKLVTFEKCGHKPMFEHPKRWNELVREFLSDHDDGTRDLHRAAGQEDNAR